MTVQPVVVQHSFGSPGSGGPIAVVDSIVDSELRNRFQFVRMHQHRSTGGIDMPRILEWARLIRDVKPAIVHIQGLGNEGFHAAAAAKLAGCDRIVVSVHGTVRDLTERKSLAQSVVWRYLEPATLRAATVVVPLCQAMASRPYLARHEAKLAAPIPNGIDIPIAGGPSRSALRTALGVQDGDVVAAVVGRVSWEKGHAELAKALELLPASIRRNLRVLVVGSGKDLEAVGARYRPVGDTVRLLGHRDDVDNILRAADVFIFPSRHENVSIALLEAMSHGLPVIATDVGGNPEVLRDGGGVLVAPNDPVALARAIEGLVPDASARSALGAVAQGNVRRNFSKERMIRAWADQYSRMLERF